MGGRARFWCQASALWPGAAVLVAWGGVCSVGGRARCVWLCLFRVRACGCLGWRVAFTSGALPGPCVAASLGDGGLAASFRLRFPFGCCFLGGRLVCLSFYGALIEFTFQKAGCGSSSNYGYRGVALTQNVSTRDPIRERMYHLLFQPVQAAQEQEPESESDASVVQWRPGG